MPLIKFSYLSSVFFILKYWRRFIDDNAEGPRIHGQGGNTAPERTIWDLHGQVKQWGVRVGERWDAIFQYLIVLWEKDRMIQINTWRNILKESALSVELKKKRKERRVEVMQCAIYLTGAYS